MIRYRRMPTPLGPLFAIAIGERIAAIHFEGGRHAPAIGADWIEDDASPVLRECARQLDEYLDGRRRAFDLPLASSGTPFQRRVWASIAAIGFGETLTYAELARRCGAPNAVRAVGAATGRNPLSIVVPCHRVLGSRGELTGYAGGLERKARLLSLEAA